MTTAYPSQAIALLNATGYVVPQRKASVGSKATGRLEWLGRAGGQQGEAGRGDRAARESGRRRAARTRRRRTCRSRARTSSRAQAELRNAELELNRARDLVARKFLSQSAYDQALARYDRAKAAVAGYKAAIGVAEAESSQRRGGGRADADPRALRRRGADQERQRGRHHHDLLRCGRHQGRGRDHGRHVHAGGRGRRVRIESAEGEGRPAGGDPARRAAGHALPGRGRAHRADGRPRQGDGAGEGELHRARRARAAGHERQGDVPRARPRRRRARRRARRCPRRRSSSRDGESVGARRRGRPGAARADRDRRDAGRVSR